MPPKVIAKNADRQGGVLPVSAAARAGGQAKPPAPRLKLEVRRLPPSLTLTEFEETLGDEWKLGNGKVDWREYRQGKTRLAGTGKVPEQSRCYIHVANEGLVRDFEKRFLEVVFHDKAGTHKNPELKHLAPTLGFAPNQRTPLQHAKQRTDNRQGTIDQDSEFIAFLEAETQPITKAASAEVAHSERDGGKPEKVTTTPLIEDLRERKANKAKAAQAKAEKVEKDKKNAKGAGKGSAVTDKDTGKAGQQQKVEQAIKEAGKAANKQAAAKQAQQAKAASPAKSKKQGGTAQARDAVPGPAAAVSGPSSPVPQRAPTGPRQRGNADGIKKMLQKDLGIRPKPTQPAQPLAPSSSTTPSSPGTSSAPTQQSTAPSTVPPKGPAPKSTLSPAQTSEAKSTSPKAYLKHANPSQGMTEILIQQALAQYGEIASVTIDPRKGTAIAVFKDNDGLKKALEAKRVPVANGAVEVLEFRDRGANGPANRGGFRGGRGGRSGGGGRGGAQTGGVASPAPAASTSGG